MDSSVSYFTSVTLRRYDSYRIIYRGLTSHRVRENNQALIHAVFHWYFLLQHCSWIANGDCSWSEREKKLVKEKYNEKDRVVVLHDNHQTMPCQQSFVNFANGRLSILSKHSSPVHEHQYEGLNRITSALFKTGLHSVKLIFFNFSY